MKKDPSQRASLWPLVSGRQSAAPQAGEIPDLIPAAERLARLVSPSMAAYLLRAAPALCCEVEALSPEEIEKARLRHRLRRHKNLEWLAALAASGFDVLVLKGMAAAHDLYPDPDLRGMGDMDLLVERPELPRLGAFLKDAGFCVHPTRTPRWGLISDASFHPLVSPDGHCVIDLHVEADDYPVHTSMPVLDVFTHSRMIAAGGTMLRIPSRTHYLLLATTNAARDKFLPFCLKGFCDFLVLVQNHGKEIDWPEIEHRAGDGGYLKPLACFLALAQALGGTREPLPGHLIPTYEGFPRLVFNQLVDDFRAFFPRTPGIFAQAQREIFLTTTTRTLIWKNTRRLKGIFSPYTGLPPD